MKKKVVCAFVLGLFVSCTMPIATFGETQENVIAVQTDQMKWKIKIILQVRS